MTIPPPTQLTTDDVCRLLGEKDLAIYQLTQQLQKQAQEIAELKRQIAEKAVSAG